MTAAAEAPLDPLDPLLHRIAIALAFVSGATSLGYQILWTRLLASGSGNTTYVFTLILSIFLIGIVVGAAVISRRMRRSVAEIATLGAIQLVIAAIVLAGDQRSPERPGAGGSRSSRG